MKYFTSCVKSSTMLSSDQSNLKQWQPRQLPYSLKDHSLKFLHTFWFTNKVKLFDEILLNLDTPSLVAKVALSLWLQAALKVDDCWWFKVFKHISHICPKKEINVPLKTLPLQLLGSLNFSISASSLGNLDNFKLYQQLAEMCCWEPWNSLNI